MAHGAHPYSAPCSGNPAPTISRDQWIVQGH
jgi:hypothetical protein